MDDLTKKDLNQINLWWPNLS